MIGAGSDAEWLRGWRKILIRPPLARVHRDAECKAKVRHTEGRVRVRRGVLTASNRLDNGAFGGRAEIKLPVGHREEVATSDPVPA